MDVVRRATTLDQLLNRRVPYKGKTAGINSTTILADLMAGPKKSWMAEVELMAGEIYPDWRDHFQKTGRRLPQEMTRNVEPRSAWQAQRPAFIKALLDWLGAGPGPELVAEMATKLDAVLEFTIFVAREFLLRNEKHHSDVFDQFQLMLDWSGHRCSSWCAIVGVEGDRAGGRLSPLWMQLPQDADADWWRCRFRVGDFMESR
jgi:hypothetical protein